MSSLSDKVSGKANQTVGKVTGNQKVEAKGKAQESKGKMKDHLKSAGDSISHKIDEAAN
jgi:uncharacterized protein YjbJ (UPF0337 family)